MVLHSSKFTVSTRQSGVAVMHYNKYQRNSVLLSVSYYLMLCWKGKLINFSICLIDGFIRNFI